MATILITLPVSKHLLGHFGLGKYQQFPVSSLTDLEDEDAAEMVEQEESPDSGLHSVSVITANEICVQEHVPNGTPLAKRRKSNCNK